MGAASACEPQQSMWQRILSTPALGTACENEQCPPYDLLREKRERGEEEIRGRDRERRKVGRVHEREREREMIDLETIL